MHKHIMTNIHRPPAEGKVCDEQGTQIIFSVFRLNCTEQLYNSVILK